MLAIEVKLLHGAIRAGSAEDTTLTGEIDEGEWPPSPARLFSALVAGGGTRSRAVLGDDSELVVLEGAPPPIILADDLSDVLLSPQVERFVVVDERSDGTVQNYPARTATVVRPSSRLAPRVPAVTYLWEDVQLSSAQLEALAARAARVAYLGCSDSPVRARIITNATQARTTREWRASEEGSAYVAVPFPGLLSVLDDAYDRWQSGEPVRRSWLPVARARYLSPSDHRLQERPAPTVFWMRFSEPIPGRHVLRVGETLKAAVLDLYGRRLSDPNDVPAVLHGHVAPGTSSYDLAYFTALIECGYEYAKGRIRGAAVLLPPGTEAEIIENVRSVLFGLRSLVLPGGRTVSTQMHAGEIKPIAAHPRRWTGPARRWVSATPVVHERRSRKSPDLDEVARWCEHAGFPRPVTARTSTAPLQPGALSLRPDEVFHGQDSRRPYSHLELHFDEPIAGPMILGRARHLGIGVMAPADERSRG